MNPKRFRTTNKHTERLISISRLLLHPLVNSFLKWFSENSRHATVLRSGCCTLDTENGGVFFYLAVMVLWSFLSSGRTP